MLTLLHLCDSLFPVGAFAHSDGLEQAVSIGAIVDAGGLRAWLDSTLHESIGRVDGPVVWLAWTAVVDGDLDRLVGLDAEAIAIRPAATVRRASRAMGLRLLTTWQSLYPDVRAERLLDAAHGGGLGPSLPVAFAAACACAGVERRAAVEAFAYTRLASTVSAAMRLISIGQHEAHALLADALRRVPAVASAIADRNAAPESFAPAADIAAMAHQYVHSRLFRS